MATDDRMEICETQGRVEVAVGVDPQLEVDRDSEYESGRVPTGSSITDVYSYTDYNGRTYHSGIVGGKSVMVFS